MLRHPSAFYLGYDPGSALSAMMTYSTSTAPSTPTKNPANAPIGGSQELSNGILGPMP